MDLECLETSLKEIRHLLSHLHGEVTALEASYSKVLHVLQGTSSSLLGRSVFFEKWKDFLSECEKLAQNCGVLKIEIDHLKKVNDTHGQLTGDEVIKRVALLLKQFESPSCIVGRYGGEGFAVAVRGADVEVLGVAEMIRRGGERLHGPVINAMGEPSDGIEWKCTLSVGMASAQRSGFDAARLLTSASEALTKAKRKGRNQVCAA